MADIDAPSINSNSNENSKLILRKKNVNETATKKDIALMISLSFLATIGYSIVLPSLYPFIRSTGGAQGIVGWAVAINSGGAFFSAPLLGWWGDKQGIKQVLVVTLLIAIGSNLMYSLSTTYWMILIARFVAGISEGNYAVALAFLSYATKKDERVLIFTISSIATVLGYIFGPALATIGTLPFFPQTLTIYRYSIPFNEFTIPGYISVISNFVCLILCFVFFKEVKKPSDEHNYQVGKLPIVGFAVCMTLMFAYTMLYTVIETIGTPYTTDAYNWSVRDNSFMWAGLGGVAIIIGMLVVPIEKFVNDRLILIMSDFFLLAGSALITDPIHKFVKLYLFLSGVVVATLGYGLSQAVISTIFSKILEGQDQGAMMGYMSSSASVARMMSPVATGYLFEYTGGKYIFLGVTALLFFTTILNIIGYKSLAPHSAQIEEVKEKEVSINSDQDSLVKTV